MLLCCRSSMGLSRVKHYHALLTGSATPLPYGLPSYRVYRILLVHHACTCSLQDTPFPPSFCRRRIPIHCNPSAQVAAPLVRDLRCHCWHLRLGSLGSRHPWDSQTHVDFLVSASGTHRMFGRFNRHDSISQPQPPPPTNVEPFHRFHQIARLSLPSAASRLTRRFLLSG